jgi:MFS transporter, DHA1 family, multidrug resistance protein
MNPDPSPHRLDRRVFAALFFSIFTSITGVGIVVPLLPVYAHDLGAGGLYIGLIFGAFALSRTFFLPYFGRRSDRVGRKPFIVAGLLGYALVSVAFLAVHDVKSLIAIRFVQGIASAMIMPVCQAYVGDLTPASREGTVMGMFNMSIFIGLSLGPLMGGFLNDRFGLDAAFMTMGVVTFLAFLMSLFLLPPVSRERNTARTAPPVAWRLLLADRTVDAIFVFRLVYTACIGTIWGFLPVYADTEFALSSSAIGLLVTLGVFTSGLLQTPMGILADRSDKRRMIVIGGLGVTSAMAAFQLSGGFRDLFLANILFGIGGSVAMAPLMAIAVQKGAAKQAMGAMMALLTMAHSVGMMIGAFASGLLMDLFPLRMIFVFGAGTMLTGVALFALLTRRPKPGESIRRIAEDAGRTPVPDAGPRTEPEPPPDPEARRFAEAPTEATEKPEAVGAVRNRESGPSDTPETSPRNASARESAKSAALPQ